MAGLDRGGSGDNRRFIQRITLFENLLGEALFLFPVQMVTAQPPSQSLPDVSSKHALRLGFLLRIAQRGWLILCFETIRDLNYFRFHFLKLAGNLRNVRDVSLVKNRRDLKRYC